MPSQQHLGIEMETETASLNYRENRNQREMKKGCQTSWIPQDATIEMFQYEYELFFKKIKKLP
jgi:hypothetical protein